MAVRSGRQGSSGVKIAIVPPLVDPRLSVLLRASAMFDLITSRAGLLGLLTRAFDAVDIAPGHAIRARANCERPPTLQAWEQDPNQKIQQERPGQMAIWSAGVHYSQQRWSKKEARERDQQTQTKIFVAIRPC